MVINDVAEDDVEAQNEDVEAREEAERGQEQVEERSDVIKGACISVSFILVLRKPNTGNTRVVGDSIGNWLSPKKHWGASRFD